MSFGQNISVTLRAPTGLICTRRKCVRSLTHVWHREETDTTLSASLRSLESGRFRDCLSLSSLIPHPARGCDPQETPKMFVRIGRGGDAVDGAGRWS